MTEILFFIVICLILFRLNEIIEILKRIEQADTPVPAARIEFYAELDGQPRKRVTKMQMKVTQKVVFSIKPVDKFGNDAKLDGVPAWALTDPSLGALTAAADGLSAEFVPAGPVGSLSVQCSGDADLGEGVQTISGELPVDLLPGDAVALQVSAGAPADA